MAELRTILEGSMRAMDGAVLVAGEIAHAEPGTPTEDLKRRLHEHYWSIGYGTNALQIRLGDEHAVLEAHREFVRAAGGVVRAANASDADAFTNALSDVGEAYRLLVEAAKELVGSQF